MFSLTSDYEQLNFEEQISKIGVLPNKDPVKFVKLLEKHFDLPTFIPTTFYNAYYSSPTNDREQSLESILAILLLMHFFHFASVPNFILLLCFSHELREFCKIKDNKVPDQSLISKFKTTFDSQLMDFFDNVALHVMNIFTEYNALLPDDSPSKGISEILVYDTTGLKPRVKENNPKTVETEVRKQSNYKSYLERKGDEKAKTFNVYSAAYGSLPKHAEANPVIKLDYSNGHFGYFYKFGMVTNGFGIPLHIRFFDEDFYKRLPTEFETPEDQKYTFDNASLYPVFSAFWKNKGNNRFTTFLGDSEFDSYDNYSFLNELGFTKVLIPINSRNTKTDTDSIASSAIPKDDEGVPYCPKDSSLSFISDGSCKGKNRSFRLKYVCPKSKKVKGSWTCTCENKCRDTNSTVTVYTYPNENLRVFSGVQRGSVEWTTSYKRRSIIERSFSSLKSHPILEKPKTHNCASMRSDVFLSATTRLITVILAFAINHTEYMSNLRKLIKVA